jgi:hypothetical protein
LQLLDAGAAAAQSISADGAAVNGASSSSSSSLIPSPEALQGAKRKTYAAALQACKEAKRWKQAVQLLEQVM